MCGEWVREEGARRQCFGTEPKLPPSPPLVPSSALQGRKGWWAPAGHQRPAEQNGSTNLPWLPQASSLMSAGKPLLTHHMPASVRPPSLHKQTRCSFFCHLRHHAPGTIIGKRWDWSLNYTSIHSLHKHTLSTCCIQTLIGSQKLNSEQDRLLGVVPALVEFSV